MNEFVKLEDREKHRDDYEADDDPQKRQVELHTVLIVKRHFLHAFRLAFAHPITGAALSFEAPLPDDLNRILKDLRRR